MTFATGPEFTWGVESVWKPVYAFKDSRGRVAVRIAPGRRGATASFGPGARRAGEALLLCGFGYYLLLASRASDEPAAFAAIATNA